MTFAELAVRCTTLARRPDGRLILDPVFLGELTGPEQRLWFQCCHDWAHGGRSWESHPVLGELLAELDPPRRAMAELHLGGAHLVREHPGTAPTIRQELSRLAQKAQVPLGLVVDLVLELKAPMEQAALRGGLLVGPMREAAHAQSSMVLWAERRSGGEGEGTVGHLLVELVPGGEQVCHPIPALAFVRLTPEFVAAEQRVLDYIRSTGLWPPGFDLRWRVARRDERCLPIEFGGDGFSGATALVLLKLLLSDSPRAHPLTRLSLGGVAVCASFQSDASFRPVGGRFAKLLEAARERALPTVSTLFVAAGQPLADLALEEAPPGSSHYCDPGTGLHVLTAAGLSQTIDLLAVEEETRWHGIDCFLPPRDPDFVGRACLLEGIRQFVETRPSGYLVIVAEAGEGKTTLLTEWLHLERSLGHMPVYHYIHAHDSLTQERDQIAACFYARLRRKHVFVEPDEWKALPVEAKLERLLRRISEKCALTGGKEVLYLEAADQAERSSSEPLLPPSLNTLPPRVFCVITSRPDLSWAQGLQGTTLWEMKDYVAVRADIESYLHRRSAQLPQPLSETLIRQILGHEAPPVFFTVASCFRELADPFVSEDRKRELRDRVAPWVMHPKELMADEAHRRLQEAAGGGITERQFWQTLGLLAHACEELSCDQLRALGLLRDDYRLPVLCLAVNFFRHRPAFLDPALPFTFAHPGYIREVRDRLSPADRLECHRLLAEGCQRVCAEPRGPATLYAIRHLPTHLREAGLVDPLCEVLTAFAFLSDYLGIDALAPPATVFELVGQFQKTLALLAESHPRRAELEALAREVAKHSHVLKNEPALLVQQIHNTLTWLTEPDSRLGREILSAAARWTRPWLRRENPLVLAAEPTLRCTLSGHQGAVTSVAFSPDDGVTLATGSADKTVRLWDPRTGDHLRLLQGHEGRVTCLAFSPDGRWLASGSEDDTLCLWEARSGRLLRRIPAGGGGVLCLAMCPDGRTLATGGPDCVVRLWDTTTWTCLHELRGHSAAIKVLAFSPTEPLLASGSEDKTVRLWQAREGRFEGALQGHDTWVDALAFSPDGRTLASGGGLRRGLIQFWDVAQRELVRSFRVHEDGICALAYSPARPTIASGSWDRTVRLQDLATGTPGPAMGHGERVEAVSFSPDGNILASASDDRTVRLWEVNPRPRAQSSRTAEAASRPVLEALVYAVDFAPDGLLAASGGRDDQVRLWQVETGALAGTLGGSAKDISDVCFAPDGGTLASGSEGEVRQWSAGLADPTRVLRGHSTWVLAVAYSAEGQWLASGGEDNLVLLWDARAGQWNKTLRGHEGRVRAVAFASRPESRWLASGGADSRVRVWNYETGAQILELPGHAGEIIDLAFSPDDRLIASGGDDQTIRLWDAATGARVRIIKAGGGQVLALAFSRDGRWLAGGCSDYALRLWDVGTGDLIAWMPCADKVLAVRFNAQRQLLAADGGGAAHAPNFYRLSVVGA